MHFFRIALLTLTFCCATALAQDTHAIDVLRRAQTAAGGVEALVAVQDQIVTRNIRSVGGGISGQQVMKIILPSALRQESVLPFGMVAISLVDGRGELRSSQGTLALSGPQLTQAQGELFRVRERLLLANQNPDLQLIFLDTVEQGDRVADVLNVTDSATGQSVQLWIDQANGEFFRSTYDSVALSGSQQLAEYYSDFRTINGVQTPFSIAIHSGSALLTEIRVEKVLHNTGLTKAELR
jgi:hypothetical protein